MPSIDEFARQATDRFVDSQRHIQAKFNLGLPRQEVEEFIKSVFHASLIPDEGRYPSVCLLCYRRVATLDCHIALNAPIEPSAQQIAKLAYATDPGSHICCICDGGKIALGGIQVTALNKLRDFGYSSHRAANPLKLLIRGPGHIETSFGGIAMIYREGEIAQEKLLQHSYLMNKLTCAVSQALRNSVAGTIESLDDIFNDLAEAIVKMEHGGILIVDKKTEG